MLWQNLVNIQVQMKKPRQKPDVLQVNIYYLVQRHYICNLFHYNRMISFNTSEVQNYQNLFSWQQKTSQAIIVSTSRNNFGVRTFKGSKKLNTDPHKAKELKSSLTEYVWAATEHIHPKTSSYTLSPKWHYSLPTNWSKSPTNKSKVQKKDISFITKKHINEQCNTLNRYRNSLRNS